MGLRFDPVGGGKFKQLVAQLIQIEREPIKKMEARKGQVEAKLKLFGEFKSKVSELKQAVDDIASFKKLVELKADLGDGEHLMDVTLDPDRARPGSYQFEIEELAGRASMISNGFADPRKPAIGIGYVVAHLGDGETYELFIDQHEASLEGIANKINDIRDSPVRATVVQDAFEQDSSYRLILSAKDDGLKAGAKFPEFYFLGGEEDFWIEDDKLAHNATLFVDGFEVEAEGNDVPNFITGVNVHLKQARPGQAFRLQITVDNKKVSEKVKNLTDKLNEVLNFIHLQNAIDENTDTSTTFAGDTGLTNIEYRLRNMLHEAFPTGDFTDKDSVKLKNLYEVGITFERTGKIGFDEQKFNQALEEDFDSVADIMAGEFGFGFQMSTVLKGYTQPLNGLLSIREKGLRDRIKQIDLSIEKQERFLEKRAEALTQRFSRLQGSLGALQAQSQQITATLGSSGGGNLVSQLLGG